MSNLLVKLQAEMEQLKENLKKKNEELVTLNASIKNAIDTRKRLTQDITLLSGYLQGKAEVINAFSQEKQKPEKTEKTKVKDEDKGVSK